MKSLKTERCLNRLKSIHNDVTLISKRCVTKFFSRKINDNQQNTDQESITPTAMQDTNLQKHSIYRTLESIISDHEFPEGSGSDQELISTVLTSTIIQDPDLQNQPVNEPTISGNIDATDSEQYHIDHENQTSEFLAGLTLDHELPEPEDYGLDQEVMTNILYIQYLNLNKRCAEENLDDTVPGLEANEQTPPSQYSEASNILWKAIAQLMEIFEEEPHLPPCFLAEQSPNAQAALITIIGLDVNQRTPTPQYFKASNILCSTIAQLIGISGK
ncbi:uncharacterized protein MELLADRAFT_102059 [Melampsora larici-populina 98AG31]|uniref:Uncharacterized protein n=1 Tax=Melampsora larici-populina (strain 98AG31 / pathotype 3-4-7) TaxID=747676 RepID=F4R5V7_MELLP|nr:uncharacterized protein MELLADRAFT_102059 [Melampsora larici-populina 98AG31]EGG12105.1 hypothetical protein MELLADRAFT_102059 [Melampsora larici-populina 98AG31]